MGKKDWQRALEEDDMSAVVSTPSRGRGWRVASMVLLLGIATFGAAYYIPLYRAHSTLTEEYKKLSAESQTQRKQLTDTIETMKKVAEERDRLATQTRGIRDTQEASAQQVEKTDGLIGAALKKFSGKGRVEIKRVGNVIELNLASPALLGLGTADVTDFGKKAMCALAGAVKSKDVQLQIVGNGADPKAKTAVSFPLAAARAANLAKQLSDSCGVETSRIQIGVLPTPAEPALGATIQIKFTKS
jgi:flagellar motor protein MotB